MTCRDIFDKIKEENVMHEKILNQKIIESQTNLKNILQKIKAEMEKNAIFSDVNYDDYQATSIKTTESQKQTQIQETQSIKESGKKLANTLEKVLNHEKRSRRNSAQLKRNKKRKIQPNNTRNTENKELEDNPKQKSPIHNTKDSTNYFTSREGNNSETNKNNSNSNKAYSVSTVQSLQFSRHLFTESSKKEEVKENIDNKDSNQKNIKSYSFRSQVRQQPMFQITKSSNFNISSTLSHKQPLSVLSEQININDENKNPSSNREGSKYNYHRIIHNFPIENLEEMKFSKEDQSSVEKVQTEETNQVDSYLNNIINKYNHNNNNKSSTLQSANNYIDNSVNHFNKSSKICEYNEDIPSNNKENKRTVSLTPVIQSRNSSTSINKSRKSINNKNLPKKYFDLLNKLDIIKKQNVYLQRKASLSKKTNKPIAFSPSKVIKRDSNSSQINNVSQSLQIQETKKPIYSSYELYKIDEIQVMDKIDNIKVKENFSSDFTEKDYFGEFIDEIIQKSFKMRGCLHCKTCLALLSQGKPTSQCQRQHYKYEYIKPK